jgi:NAD+ kinase
MKILVLENPTRLLAAADRLDFLKLMEGHEVVCQPMAEKRTRGPENHHVDLIIAVGGDGTVLHAAHYGFGKGIPILGFNTGHVGFLAGITVANFREELPHILSWRCIRENRMALCVKMPDGTEGWGFNDIGFQVVDRDLFAAEMLLNGKKVCDYKGDGLVAATATGATAYNLSLGGPLLAPNSEMVAVTPKAPLTLTNRTLVLNDPEVLAFRITGGRTRIENDSIPIGEVGRGDVVYVHRSPVTVPIVFPANHNHYLAVGQKLRWNEALITR